MHSDLSSGFSNELLSKHKDATTLIQKQWKFSLMVAHLISFAYSKGYAISLAEAYRTPEQAALNAKNGRGISNSLHTMRLAIDINLFKDGGYLRESKDYEELGLFWESLGGSWGGRFSRPDGNHFSLSHNGVR